VIEPQGGSRSLPNPYYNIQIRIVMLSMVAGSGRRNPGARCVAARKDSLDWAHGAFVSQRDLMGRVRAHGAGAEHVSARPLGRVRVRARPVAGPVSPGLRRDRTLSFSAETEALRRLDHPHVIRLYDCFRDGINFVMILELCPGGNLMDEAGNGGLSIPRLITVVPQIVDALMFCHANLVPHCDLKPQNILLDGFGRVKLADFGLSVIRDDWDRTLAFAGSPVFAAPEVLAKEPHSKFQADVWSFGVMLAVLATGRVPWAR